VWLVTDPGTCAEKYPEYARYFHPRHTRRYNEFPLKSVKLYMESGYIMATHEFSIRKKDSHPDQVYIRLWHGCGYKDTEKKSDGTILFDKALVPGPLFIGTKAAFWNMPETAFLAKGLPRYDWLRSTTEKARHYADSLRDRGGKLIIWMPTFRNNRAGDKPENIISTFPLLARQSDWEALDQVCREQKTVVLVKLHMVQKEYAIDFSRLTNIRKLTNDDFDAAGITMYDFLGATDGLISDYSSVAVDYLVVDKPLAFALDDFEVYRNTRGFVFEDPRVYMPGHHMYTREDLYRYVSDVAREEDPYRQKRLEMMEQGLYRSDGYCAEILRELGIC